MQSFPETEPDILNWKGQLERIDCKKLSGIYTKQGNMKRIILLLAGFAFLTIKNQAQTVIDYDGNVYDTVIIGSQVWMKQNLKVVHYNNGIPIPNVPNSTAWANLTTGARCYYNNDSVANDSVYGPLYNWYSAHDPNICPAGWHISTNAEWQTAETYLGGVFIAGGKMKEADTLHWFSPNTGANNSSGFTGLPGGFRDPASDFQYIGENGLWWTTTVYTTSTAWSTYLWYLFTGVDHNPTPKKYGLSLRCVKDIGSRYRYKSFGKRDLYNRTFVYKLDGSEKVD